MFASQGEPPDKASQYIPWKGMNPNNLAVFRMVRCAMVLYDRAQPPAKAPGSLPMALLVSDWIHIEQRDLILGYIGRPNFDPMTTVVLERPPDIKTESSSTAPGTVYASRRSTDEIEIVAELSRPAVLVVTENFSTAWRARALGSSQPSYRILPANWAQMAIPLQAGKHRLMLEYLPESFRIGRWVSIFALLGMIVTSFLLMRRSTEFR
jgi:hypothetical protein